MQIHFLKSSPDQAFCRMFLLNQDKQKCWFSKSAILGFVRSYFGAEFHSLYDGFLLSTGGPEDAFVNDDLKKRLSEFKPEVLKILKAIAHMWVHCL